jgi:hypothetical protein
MTIWALIENKQVVELTDIDPEGRFHPSMRWLAAPEGVQVGWLHDEENGFGEPAPVVMPPPTREEIELARLIAYSDPVSGSDRFFAESARMQAMGEQGWEAVRDEGVARYQEIQASHPWGDSDAHQ